MISLCSNGSQLPDPRSRFPSRTLIVTKPAASKGIYLKKISISTTMGPGIRIDPASVVKAAA